MVNLSSPFFLHTDMINDKYIINYFYSSTCLKGKLLKRIPNDILEYLNNRFSDSESIKETLFRIKHGLQVRPTCPICGGILTFNQKGYFSEHCSKKCTKLARTSNIKKTKLERHGSENYNNRESAKQTCLENYGVENVAQSDASKEKSKRTCLEKYGAEYASQSDNVKEKAKQTCLERYGCEYVLQSDEFKEQSRKTCLERYGVEYHVQSNEFKEQSRKTCLEKYGTEHASQSDSVKDKTKQTLINRYGSTFYRNIEKSKQTCLIKYGVERAVQSKNVKDKIKTTNLNRYGTEYAIGSKDVQKKIQNRFLEKYGVNWYVNSDAFKHKIKSTFLEKYGVDNPVKHEPIKEKIKETNLDRYGVPCVFQANEIKASIKNSLLEHYGVDSPAKSKVIQTKMNETKRKNNSFNKSALEDRIYLFLKEKYNDVIRQYSSEEYPFNCDFYLPQYNIYIEVQGSWTHGGHPYIGTDDDIKQVNKWKNKGTEYYNNAVVTWIVRDVHKRETARKNKLKYIELFSENYIELEEKINDLVE